MNSLTKILKDVPELDPQKILKKFHLEDSAEGCYAQDGVNVQVGDLYSAIAGGLSRLSYNNSPFVEVESFGNANFRGPRGYDFKNLPKGTKHTTVNDGTGTKVGVTAAANSFHNAAYDLVAMLTTDVTRYGGKAAIFSNVLDVNSLGNDINGKTFLAAVLLQKGLAKVAKENGLVVINGETAELGQFVGSEDPDAILKYNWGGAMQGFYHRDKMILGDEIKKGDVVIALKENGFRSNGISSVRKSLKIKFGEEWYKNNQAKEFISFAAIPSTLYDNLLTDLNGRNTLGDNPSFKKKIGVHGIAHISGGGLEGKFFSDILKNIGLSAHLDNLFGMPTIMKQCAEWRNIPAKELYGMRNAGQGALVIVDPKDVDSFINHSNYHGVRAQQAGEITEAKGGPSLTILSKDYNETVIYK